MAFPWLGCQLFQTRSCQVAVTSIVCHCCLVQCLHWSLLQVHWNLREGRPPPSRGESELWIRVNSSIGIHSQSPHTSRHHCVESEKPWPFVLHLALLWPISPKIVGLPGTSPWKSPRRWRHAPRRKNEDETTNSSKIIFSTSFYCVSRDFVACMCSGIRAKHPPVSVIKKTHGSTTSLGLPLPYQV